MFLAHFTGSGINEVLDYEVNFYYIALNSALELYTEETNKIVRVVVAGLEKGD